MSSTTDIAKIAEQEAQLLFDAFDEATAFEIGSRIRARGLKDKLPIIIDIRLWDRPLFYAALPGSTGSNNHWARRKRHSVEMFLTSTYKLVLEERLAGKALLAIHGLNAADYVLAGGGFPIKVKGVGAIGVIAVSGAPQRQDHEIIVQALCEHLGLDFGKLALGVED